MKDALHQYGMMRLCEYRVKVRNVYPKTMYGKIKYIIDGFKSTDDYD